MGIQLKGKTVGIIGLGNVGSEVARRVQAFEMHPVGYDPLVSPDYAQNLGVALVSLDKLLKEADFITLHLPLIPETNVSF